MALYDTEHCEPDRADRGAIEFGILPLSDAPQSLRRRIPRLQFRTTESSVQRTFRELWTDTPRRSVYYPSERKKRDLTREGSRVNKWKTNRTSRQSSSLIFKPQPAADPRFSVGVCCSAARQPQENPRRYTRVYQHVHARTHACPGRRAAFFPWAPAV